MANSSGAAVDGLDKDGISYPDLMEVMWTGD
jgi:hypothetical protein